MATVKPRKFLAVLIVVSMVLSVLPTSAVHSATALSSLKIGSYIVSVSTGDYTGWSSTSKTGWRYEEPSDRLILVDYRNKSNNITATGDLTITEAGLNQVGGINVDGDLTFNGSGIIMAESLTVTGSISYNGPAVFIKKSGGEYILQNNGTLDDEKYSLLSGCTYIIPSGKTLTLASIDHNIGDWDDPERFSTVTLTIPSGSTMNVEGVVVVGSVEKNNLSTIDHMVSDIVINGALSVANGASINNSGWIHLNSSGTINCSGTGRINGGSLFLSETAPAFNIRVNNADIFVKQENTVSDMQNAARILTVAGPDSTLQLPHIDVGAKRDFCLASISLESGSKLDVSSYSPIFDKAFSLMITNGISGSGTFQLTSGVVNIPNAAGNEPTSVNGGILSVNSTGWKVITKPATYTSEPANNYFAYTASPQDRLGALSYPTAPTAIASLDSFSSTRKTLYDDIIAVAKTELSNAGYDFIPSGDYTEITYGASHVANYDRILVEVSGLDNNGKVFSAALGKPGDTAPTNIAGNIFLINVLYLDVIAISWGAGVESSASSVYTGKGTLGSVSGPWPVPIPQPSTPGTGGGSGGGNTQSQSNAPTQPVYEPMKPDRPAGTEVDAEKTNNPLFLDGKQVDFPAVKIDGWNWLKLRDVAMMLKGTSKQFSIGYDPATKTIIITTGGDYEPIGDELLDMLLGDFAALASGQKIMFNGKLVEIAAYNIEGYNYFRLRDLMILLNIAVIYDPATGEITLDLTKPYSG